MLDIKFIRENQNILKKAVQDRNLRLDIAELIKLDELRRQSLKEVEDLRRQQNIANEEISRLLKEKKDAKPKVDLDFYSRDKRRKHK